AAAGSHRPRGGRLAGVRWRSRPRRDRPLQEAAMRRGRRPGVWFLCAVALALPRLAHADGVDHLPPGPPAAAPPDRPAVAGRRARPADAGADTSVRVFVSLISGRDESGRDLNLMSMNVTNYGFVGNNFTVRTPSMEYPVGTGHEHLVRGGLWVGALAFDQNGAFTG